MLCVVFFACVLCSVLACLRGCWRVTDPSEGAKGGPRRSLEGPKVGPRLPKGPTPVIDTRTFGPSGPRWGVPSPYIIENK